MAEEQRDHFVEVKIPMMPKGVEHSDAKKRRAARVLVKIPMMPKGVEHGKKKTKVSYGPG